MGLEGVGVLRELAVLGVGLRIEIRSSLSPAPSPTPLGLRLGCVDPGSAGPPERKGLLSRQDFRNLTHHAKSHYVIFITEVRMSSLAVVRRGAALRLVARGCRRCTRGGGGSGVFAGSVGDGAGPDSSETQTAARPRLTAISLRYRQRDTDRRFNTTV